MFNISNGFTHLRRQQVVVFIPADYKKCTLIIKLVKYILKFRVSSLFYMGIFCLLRHENDIYGKSLCKEIINKLFVKKKKK